MPYRSDTLHNEASQTKPAPSAYVDVDEAAARLATTPNALRARCRRNARREGRVVSAHLGGGIVAIKFGVSWRVRFPD